jgi:hypothetical protein
MRNSRKLHVLLIISEVLALLSARFFVTVQ